MDRGGCRDPVSAEDATVRGVRRGGRAVPPELLGVAAIETPLGVLWAARAEAGLCALAYPERWENARAHLSRHAGSHRLRQAALPEVRDALVAYFQGELGALSAVPLSPRGTAFQRAVWAALSGVPPGETRTYVEIARALDRPRAVRAVGGAVGANPLAVVIPCHRVVAADAGIGGYAGGLERKRWLLAHEGTRLTPPGGAPASNPPSRPRGSPKTGRAGESRSRAR